MNLGKHVALHHMELAQLWHCPVSWCTVWKGTAQDCVDHMRRAHDIPPSAKAANLARWFPPWTVTREQWHSMSRPVISGIAIDTLLFSRIGVPLFHRYRVFDQQGTHAAFRGTYMRRMHTFLEESDAASLRMRHRRRAHCSSDVADIASAQSGQVSGCFVQTDGFLSLGFPGSEIYRVGDSGVLIEGRGDCSLSSCGG